MIRKRSRLVETQSAVEGQRMNGRACINCHQRKIRCDILDRGVPCTHCSSHNRPRCRIFPKKKTREAITRLRGPVSIRPHEPSHELMPETEPSSTGTESPLMPDSTVLAPREESEPGGTLVDLFNRDDARSSELNRQTRSCFIGNDLSNCHYLIRQSSSNTDSDGISHFGSRQFQHQDTSYNLHRVTSDILELPDKTLADMLVKAYFDNINCWWPIVDEEWFMAQYDGKDPHGPPPLALLNAIFLVGTHVLASRDSHMTTLQAVFFCRAKTLVECRLEQDRVMYVQVALLLTWYSDGLEEIVANAWHWIGTATRTATALGMHRDVTHSKMQPVYKRTYTRLWWVLFQFDTIASASSGRPQVMNLEDSDVPELQHSHFEGIPQAECDFVIHQSKLCTLISQTIRRGWALRSSTKSRVDAIRKADEDLAEFMLQLPAKLQLMHSNLNNGQAVLHLTYNNFILLLHRPAPRPHAGGSAIEICTDPIVCGDAIAEIGSIFETLLNQETLSSMWFYGNHVLFTAIIYAMNEFSSDKPLIAVKSRRLLRILIRSLRGLSECWRFAQSLLQVFEERLSRLESCNNARTTINLPAPQCAEDLGQQSREASTSESSLDYTQLRTQGVEAKSVWNNVEDQIPGEFNTEVANDQSSSPTTMSNPATGGLIPEVIGDGILNGFPLFDDFTMDFFLTKLAKMKEILCRALKLNSQKYLLYYR